MGTSIVPYWIPAGVYTERSECAGMTIPPPTRQKPLAYSNKLCYYPHVFSIAAVSKPFVGGRTTMPGGASSGTNWELKISILLKNTRLEVSKYTKLELIHPCLKMRFLKLISGNCFRHNFFTLKRPTNRRSLTFIISPLKGEETNHPTLRFFVPMVSGLRMRRVMLRHRCRGANIWAV